MNLESKENLLLAITDAKRQLDADFNMYASRLGHAMLQEGVIGQPRWLEEAKRQMFFCHWSHEMLWDLQGEVEQLRFDHCPSHALRFEQIMGGCRSPEFRDWYEQQQTKAALRQLSDLSACHQNSMLEGIQTASIEFARVYTEWQQKTQEEQKAWLDQNASHCDFGRGTQTWDFDREENRWVATPVKMVPASRFATNMEEAKEKGLVAECELGDLRITSQDASAFKPADGNTVWNWDPAILPPTFTKEK